ncbi:PspC domain-containing protein [Parabacteroides bouchesdurhonensis]|uniref:PspC domain-containing protein n=1 Tax=Parabacteroides bouchesdurhonensis TaxID=1936995 RepID=UPI000E479929|nr:PspC domain-containing protein [Parabacteroides bouchesdurhonensis]RHJ94217.1 PspC domain-containing protein [Bacteroides sp. AM07-16]
MKKTLTVNLGGTVFHIDEDAYQLLDKYLSNLRIHFKEEEGSDEIMGDFELRISELLNERVRLGYNVITIENVEEVIKRMGKPEEIFDEEKESSQHKEEQKAHSFQENQTYTGKKRLMRDPDNRVLGGVAGGIAAYLGWDVTAVRLVMIILLLIPYAPIVLIYIILWIVMPVARTAADKLIMRGENVTLENIGKTVTDGFEKVSNNVNDYISSEKPRNFFQKLADTFVLIIGFILKFLAILIGIILLPALLLIIFILFIVTIALTAGGAGVLYELSPFGMDLSSGFPIPMVIIGCLGTILLIGIPVFSLIYAICGQLFKAKPLPAPAKWVLLLLWIIALVICIIYSYQTGMLLDWNNYWIGHHHWNSF